MLQRLDRFYADKRVRMALLGAFFLLVLLPQWNLAEIPSDGGTIPVSMCYLFSLVFAPWLLTNLRRWRLPPWPVAGLFVYVLVYTAFADLRWGFGRTVLNWLFGAYLLVAVLSMGRDFAYTDWQKLLAWGMVAFAAIELVNVLTQLSGFSELAERLAKADEGWMDYYRPALTSLTRGGPNLDASWLALGCFFQYKKGVKYPYFAFAALFSVLYLSRVGMLACGLYVLWALLFDGDWRPTKRTAWVYLALLAAAVVAVLSVDFLRVAFMRLLGKLNGGDLTAGRGGMWGNVPAMFRDNPFGYGCGNAMRVMKASYGFTSYEDNMHNVFLQFLLDEGFVGLLWFMGLVAAFLLREGKTGFRHPLAGYFVGYLLLSLVQFHGGEVQMQFVLAVYLSVRVLGEAPWPARDGKPAAEPLPLPTPAPSEDA